MAQREEMQGYEAAWPSSSSCYAIGFRVPSFSIERDYFGDLLAAGLPEF